MGAAVKAVRDRADLHQDRQADAAMHVRAGDEPVSLGSAAPSFRQPASVMTATLRFGLAGRFVSCAKLPQLNANIRRGPLRLSMNATRCGARSSPDTEAGRLGLKLETGKEATMRFILIGLIGALPFVASPVLAADAATQEANRKAVLEFYKAG